MELNAPAIWMSSGVCVATVIYFFFRRRHGGSVDLNVKDFDAIPRSSKSFQVLRNDIDLGLAKESLLHGGIFRCKLFLWKDLVVLSDQDASREFFGNSNFVRDIHAAPHSLIVAHLENWKQQRQVLAKTLSPSGVTIVFDTIKSLVTSCLDYIREWEEVNMLPVITKLLQETVLKVTFGDNVSDQDRDNILQTYQVYEHERDNMLWRIPGYSLLPLSSTLRITKLISRFKQFAWNLLKTNLPANSFMARMMEETTASKTWNSKNVVDNSLIYMLAGVNTNSSAIGWVLYFLAKYPEHQEKSLEDVTSVIGTSPFEAHHVAQFTYLKMAIKETLRLYPAFDSSFKRFSDKDEVICGYRIPKGTRVLVDFGGLHRNPNLWPNPETFDPERFRDYKGKPLYTPFGHGPMMCVGRYLAHYIMEILLAVLIQKFKFRLGPSEVQEGKKTAGGGIMAPRDGVMLVLERRT